LCGMVKLFSRKIVSVAQIPFSFSYFRPHCSEPLRWSLCAPQGCQGCKTQRSNHVFICSKILYFTRKGSSCPPAPAGRARGGRPATPIPARPQPHPGLFWKSTASQIMEWSFPLPPPPYMCQVFSFLRWDKPPCDVARGQGGLFFCDSHGPIHYH